MLFGAPFDAGTTFRPGARFGPRGVRLASALTRGYSAAHDVAVFETLKACDGGDVPCVPMQLEQSLNAIEARVGEIVDAGAVPGMVGGDHLVSLPALRALAKRHGPLRIVHFDAHSDTFGPAWGVDLHHGTVFRKAVEEGLVADGGLLQVGIRGPYTSVEDLDFARAHGIDVMEVDALKRDFAAAEARVAAHGAAGPCYITFDMDSLDPAYAPGTGTPVPGGLTSWEALTLVRALRGSEVLGMDVVEISPDHDASGNTCLLAASLLGEMVALVAAAREARA